MKDTLTDNDIKRAINFLSKQDDKIPEDPVIYAYCEKHECVHKVGSADASECHEHLRIIY